jgi:hypothetical protein
MSFVARILGRQPQSDLPPALATDLSRLRAVRAALGRSNWPFGLKFPEAREQLHQASIELGNRLAQAQPAGRQPVVDAFMAADKVLPREVTASRAAADAATVRSVVETGCADLGLSFDEAQLAAIHAHLRTKPVLLSHDAHVAKESVPSLDAIPSDKNYGCYNYLDLWSSPHILEAVTQDRIIDLAQAYLGCTPTLYSINAFWSLPNRQPNKASQKFHRDWEDFRSCVVFTQLTPVDEPEEGAHYFVETSHEVDRFRAAMRAQGISDEDTENLLIRDENVIAPTALRLFETSAHRFDGPAGRSFCTDGYGLHRAAVPRSRPRLLLWFRFGNFFNETMYKMALPGADRAVAQSVLGRIPNTPRHQYVFRYMIEALSAV